MRVPKGGTALMTRDPKKVHMIKPATKALKEAYATGRVTLYWLDLGKDNFVLTAVVYGKPCGSTCLEARETTQQIIRAALEEFAL